MREQVRRSRFDTTSWSLVLAAAGERNERQSAVALEELCARYWHPVHAFISRHFATSQAEDLTQAFFTKLLEKNYVAAADRSRGRFRTFLLTAARNFVVNEIDSARTQKRGGAVSHVSLDVTPEVLQTRADRGLSPDELFQRRWALTLLDQVLQEMRREAAERNDEHFETLLPFVLGESTASYASVAETKGATAGSLRVAVHRVRMQFRQRLREAVASTVAEKADVDDEIRFLIEAVSRRGDGDAA